MRIETPSGLAHVFVKHSKFDPDTPNERTTRVSVRFDDAADPQAEHIGISHCVPQDQFSKLTGRRIATNRVLKSLNQASYPKETRLEVFKAVCPEFFKINKDEEDESQQ